MANAIIHIIGTDEITYFVSDCIQEGNNFLGSNYKLYGIKPRHYNIKWTNDDAVPIHGIINEESGITNVIGWKEKVSELSDALRYNNVVVSNKENVNNITINKIRERYSTEDELKLHRLKLSGVTANWTEYVTFVDTVVEEGNQFKDTNFPETIE